MSDASNLRTAHELLYAQIPTFECKPGCNKCCGPIPSSPWEREQLSLEQRRKIDLERTLTLYVQHGCHTCELSTIAGCAIYDKRPFMCRLFGAVDDPKLECPEGCGPERKLTKAQGDALTARYVSLCGG